jgi:hypothetical protein
LDDPLSVSTDVENSSQQSDESVVEVSLENGNDTLETISIDSTSTNGSLVNETVAANTTTGSTIKRFVCLLDENFQGESVFQVIKD